MRNKTFFKEFFRTISRSKTRFFSIVTIIAIGVGFFAGINATEPDMILSADKYFEEKNLADFRVISPLGFEEEDIEQLEKLPGIEEVQAEYWVDIFAESEEGYTSIVRLYSYDEKDFIDGNGLNKITVDKGRLPEKSGEIVIQTGGNVPLDLVVGSEVRFIAPNGEDLSKMIEGETYTVVGTITSPLYIGYERGYTNIGDGSIDFYAYVHKDAFRLEKPNHVYVQTEKSKQLTAFTEQYDEHIENIQPSIERLGETITEEEKSSLMEEIRVGKEELEEKKSEAEAELSRAEDELIRAEAEIEDAEKQLREKEAELETELKETEKQILVGERKLLEGKKDYEAKLRQWEEGYSTYDYKRRDLEQVSERLNEAAKEISEANQQLEQGAAELSIAKEELDAAYETIERLHLFKEQLAQSHLMTKEEYIELVNETFVKETEIRENLLLLAEEMFYIPFFVQAIDTNFLPNIEKAYEEGKKAYEEGLAQYEEGKQELDEKTKEYEEAVRQYEDGLSQLQAAKRELDDGKLALEEGKRELEAKEKELLDGKAAFEEGKKTFALEIEDARKEIEEGKTELDEGWQSYEEEKEKAINEIKEAEKELEEAEQMVNDLPDGWIVNNRNNFPSYTMYGEDAERIGAVAKVFPLFFFFVAALVSFTTMARMVEEERTQIGTLKGLGYKPSLIISKYLSYALIASLLGSIIGLTVGFWLFPTAIMNAYEILYSIEERLTPFHWDYAILSTFLAIVTTVLTTYFATKHELRANPAILMQPRAPKPGKRIFLEKIKPLWSRLSFSQKVTFRNLFRYKVRFYMTMFGIAGCAGLLVAGFGLSDSVNDVMGKQYNDIFLYDGQILLDLNEGDDVFDLEPVLKKYEEISSSLAIYNESVEVISDNGTNAFDANIVVPASRKEINDFVAMQHRVTKDEVTLSTHGAVLTEKLADILQVDIGDTITYRDTNNHSYALEVAAITENYLSQYIYVSSEYWEEVTEKEVPYNAWMFKVENIKEMDKSRFLEQLMREDLVMAAYFNEDIAEKYEDTMKSLDSVVLIIIISAGALAFVVLYNLTNINITERIREIATLKVLGFRHREVDSYVFRENFILIVLGTLLGLVLGNILHYYVIITMEIDTMMFGREVHNSSYIWSILLTLIFSTSVNFFMHFKLKNINMVESLKSVD